MGKVWRFQRWSDILVRYGLEPIKGGTLGWLFASSDRVAVMFGHEDGCVPVEVMAYEPPVVELERGIYQCVK